jgi:hypothetical protein
VQVAVLLLLVLAVIVAVPALTAVTFPLETVATFLSLDVHVTVLSVASEGVTVAVRVSLEPSTRESDVLFSGSFSLRSAQTPPNLLNKGFFAFWHMHTT